MSQFQEESTPYSYTNAHAFHPQIAADYGVDIAILVHYMHFWIDKNARSGKNHYDGHTWMYQPLKDLKSAFPYWTVRQVEWLIKKAVSKGILIKGNYNNTKYDRTCWYAFADEKKFSISQNCEMEKTELRNGFRTNVTPIPVNKTVNKKEEEGKPLPSSGRKKKTKPKGGGFTPYSIKIL